VVVAPELCDLAIGEAESIERSVENSRAESTPLEIFEGYRESGCFLISRWCNEIRVGSDCNNPIGERKIDWVTHLSALLLASMRLVANDVGPLPPARGGAVVVVAQGGPPQPQRGQEGKKAA
jgi:hypothetical protein